jgi:hypothetical protein
MIEELVMSLVCPLLTIQISGLLLWVIHCCYKIAMHFLTETHFQFRCRFDWNPVVCYIYILYLK